MLQTGLFRNSSYYNLRVVFCTVTGERTVKIVETTTEPQASFERELQDLLQWFISVDQWFLFKYIAHTTNWFFVNDVYVSIENHNQAGTK